MRSIFTFLLCFSFTSLLSQYSNNPALPFAVCNAANAQSNVQAISDGTGGHFVFWIDKRNNSTTGEIFGQHLDAGGNEQWTSNGKLIQSSSGNITDCRITLWQTGILLSYLQSGSAFTDSLKAIYLDYTGNPLWSQPVTIAHAGSGFLYLNTDGFNVFPNDSGATITHSYTYSGGSSGFTFNRIDFNGNLHWPVLSKIYPLQGYNYRSASDGGNGIYALSKGNGLGSTIYIQRFNLQGVQMWSTGTEITSSTSSLGFGGNINMEADDESNLYLVWDGNSGDILATKLTPDGSFAWSPIRRFANDSSATYTSTRSHARLRDQSLYITWLETRTTGVTSTIVQRFDTSGTIQWTGGGMLVDTANGYYAYPRVAFSDSGSIILTYLGTGNVDLTAQRIMQDGSVAWNDGVVMASVPATWISYSDYVAVDDDDGCNAVFWTSFDNNIYGARICSDGMLVNISEGEQGSAFSVWPNPTTGPVNLLFNGKIPDVINIYDMHARLLKSVYPFSDVLTLNAGNLSTGLYLIECITEMKRSMMKIQVIH